MKINEEYFKLKDFLYDCMENDIPINIGSLKNTIKELNKQPLGKNGRFISEVHWHIEYIIASENVYAWISFYYYDTVATVHTEVGSITINKAKYIGKNNLLINFILPPK